MSFILLLLSQIFERLNYDQLNEYPEQYLNSLLCDFWKAYSNQHALFILLQTWQNELEKSRIAGTILMDLARAYDCLPHDLLIAKIEAYDINKSGLNYDQLNEYPEQYLNSLLCDFWKAYSNHALFILLQTWQNELEKSRITGTILMDLARAYDCLPHDLLIAKIEAYDINKSGLNLLLSYSSNQTHRPKINSYSDWYDIIRDVPQGSILGSLLLNLYINDVFLFVEKAKICNFTDHNKHNISTR